MTMTIEELLANLDATTRDGFRVGEGLSPKRYKTPSMGMNVALGGGFGAGRIATIHGTKSAGKSAFAMQIIAMAQKEGALCGWIDAEKTFDDKWAARLGADTSQLLVSKAADMHKAGDQLAALCKAGADIVVVDSGSALIQPSYFEKDSDDVAMDNTKQIGSFSKGLKALLRIANYVNEETLIIFIMQESMASVGTMFIPKAEGGKAIEYYSSQVVRLVSNNSESPTSGDLIKGIVYNGNTPLNRKVGRKVHWEVVFNKLGPQGGSGEYEFYFAGDNVGVDDRLELINICVEYGIVNKGGAWYSFERESGDDFKAQGTKKFIEAMEEDNTIYEELMGRVELVL